MMMENERVSRRLRSNSVNFTESLVLEVEGGGGGGGGAGERGGVRNASAMEQQPQSLIPGLPDDLALECLVRVPRSHHGQMRSVSSGWRALLRGDQFYAHRARNGLTEHWIYVLTYNCQVPKNTWQAYDPRSGRWHKLPDMPEAYRSAYGLRAAVLHNMLFVFGGQEGVAKKCIEGLWKFDPRTMRWSMGAPMQTSRAHFASAVVNGSLYVAGGYGTLRGDPIDSVEVYNPLEDSWEAIEPMPKPRALCHALGLRGCFYVRDKCLPLCAPGPVSVNVYDAEKRTWQDVQDPEMISGWRGCTAVADGRLYVSNQSDQYCLKVYEAERKCWIKAPGLHRLFLYGYSRKQKPPFKMTGFDGKIVAAGRGPTLTIIDVRKAMEARGGDGEEGVVEVADNTPLWSTVGLSADSTLLTESVQVIGL